jgi:hypothetical protein
MPLSSTTRPATPKITEEMASFFQIHSYDPNERPTKMGLDLRMTPLRRLPRAVLYNVIASMILAHSTGTPAI